MPTSKGSRHPEKNAQLLVRQLTLVRRNERLKGLPMEDQLEIAADSLRRKGVLLTDEVFAEARRRIHTSHERTIRRPAIVEKANNRADGILGLLQRMLNDD